MNECSDIELLLADAAASALPREESERLEAHLRTCAGCAGTFARIRELLGRRPARAAVPDAYWTTVVPRVRKRLDSRTTFELPRYVLRFVSPGLAAAFLLAVGAELIPTRPGSSSGDAASLLTSLPETELASLALRHDSEAPIILPADAAENDSPDLEEGNILQEIVENETGVNLYAYLDPDLAVGNLAEADQIELISMLEHP